MFTHSILIFNNLFVPYPLTNLQKTFLWYLLWCIPKTNIVAFELRLQFVVTAEGVANLKANFGREQ